jgi:hypothetical protein
MLRDNPEVFDTRGRETLLFFRNGVKYLSRSTPFIDRLADQSPSVSAE